MNTNIKHNLHLQFVISFLIFYNTAKGNIGIFYKHDTRNETHQYISIEYILSSFHIAFFYIYKINYSFLCSARAKVANINL